MEKISWTDRVRNEVPMQSTNDYPTKSKNKEV